MLYEYLFDMWVMTMIHLWYTPNFLIGAAPNV